MKIAVIAASGRSGQEFVAAAMNAGHQIRAGVRGKSDFTDSALLEVITCDATKLDDVSKLIVGCDAVASFIGHGRKSPDSLQTESIKNVLQATKKADVKRLISLTGTGVRFPGDKITLIDRFMNLSISVIDPARVKDGVRHVEEIKNSDLDWTVVRVLKLTNGQTQTYGLSQKGPTRIFTSRKTVAQACLEVLEKELFLRQAPIITS